MKMKKSDVNLLLIVFGILIAVASYFFVYQKLNEKTEELEASNAVLQDEVNKLQELADHQQEYLDETQAMNAYMEEVEKEFAASYRPEDEILYVDGIEKTFKAEVASISMPGSYVIEVPYTPGEGIAIGGEVAPAEGEEGAEPVAVSAEPPVRLYSTPVSISYVASYDSIKELLLTMSEDNMKKSIETLSMAFDGASGDITGGLSFNMYSMTGTDAVYEVPQVQGVTFGTNNIFNSASRAAAISAE